MTAAMLDFELPADLQAREPVEADGRRRDDVRLLVNRGVEVSHHRFTELPRLLAPGDLLVVNNSATLPAALDAQGHQEVHVSNEQADGTWLIELRGKKGGRAGDRVRVPDGTLTLLRPYTNRLWTVQADVSGSM